MGLQRPGQNISDCAGPGAAIGFKNPARSGSNRDNELICDISNQLTITHSTFQLKPVVPKSDETMMNLFYKLRSNIWILSYTFQSVPCRDAKIAHEFVIKSFSVQGRQTNFFPPVFLSESDETWKHFMEVSAYLWDRKPSLRIFLAQLHK